MHFVQIIFSPDSTYPWVYIQTELGGKFVLTPIPPIFEMCDVRDKEGDILPDSNQLWRHEDSGLLRNKAQRTKCLDLASHSHGTPVKMAVGMFFISISSNARTLF